MGEVEGMEGGMKKGEMGMEEEEEAIRMIILVIRVIMETRTMGTS